MHHQAILLILCLSCWYYMYPVDTISASTLTLLLRRKKTNNRNYYNVPDYWFSRIRHFARIYEPYVKTRTASDILIQLKLSIIMLELHHKWVASTKNYLPINSQAYATVLYSLAFCYSQEISSFKIMQYYFKFLSVNHIWSTEIYIGTVS